MTLPAQSKFYMPAEWEPHEAVWLAWPHDLDSFPHLEEARDAFAEFIKEVHTDERVELLVLDEKMKTSATEMLASKGMNFSRINFHIADYADIWFRDYGPIFVHDQSKPQPALAMTKWIFNAWGNKYQTLLKDNEIPYKIQERLNLPMIKTNMVLEGGSIEVNGAGTLLTTEACLLNKNRNPNLSKPEIEEKLKNYLGARKIIWLKKGIAGDDTDGHIDDIARFANSATVLCARPDDETDSDFPALRENFEILQKALDQNGKPFEVVKLPTPGVVLGDNGKRLPASYANFYVSNAKVLVPVFGTEHDEEALAVIAAAFRGRKVAGIRANVLVSGLGAFHCLSQQQPV